jgi:hyperosmotically inducible protein
MKIQIYWLLACAAGVTACASSNPEARPDATRRESTPVVVSTHYRPAARTTPRASDNTTATSATPARREHASSVVVHHPETAHRHNAPVVATEDAVADPSATAEADNTKVNERDRNDGTLTAMDQGNGEQDVKITQQIRQAVMDDDSLSFNAKNVKIITIDGKVTLRGPVANSKERTTIGAAAKKVAGGARVDNQLEVEK